MDLRRISTALTQAQKLVVVPLAELKLAARISHADEDSLIQDDIEAAYDFLAGPGGEGWLNGCRLLEEEWEMFLPSNFGCGFDLPLRPLSGATLTGFGWIQADGSYSDVDAALFGLTTSSTVGRIARLPAKAWPYLGAYNPRAYRIRFKAGFGANRTDIPSGLRKAIRMLAAHWFVNREAVGADGRKVGEEVLYGLRALASQYRFHPDHS